MTLRVFVVIDHNGNVTVAPTTENWLFARALHHHKAPLVTFIRELKKRATQMAADAGDLSAEGITRQLKKLRTQHFRIPSPLPKAKALEKAAQELRQSNYFFHMINIETLFLLNMLAMARPGGGHPAGSPQAMMYHHQIICQEDPVTSGAYICRLLTSVINAIRKQAAVIPGFWEAPTITLAPEHAAFLGGELDLSEMREFFLSVFTHIESLAQSH